MYSTDIRITVMEAVKTVTLLLDKNSLNSEAKIFTVKQSLTKMADIQISAMTYDPLVRALRDKK